MNGWRDIMHAITERRWRFLAGFLAVFFFTLLFLALAGLAPDDLVSKPASSKSASPVPDSVAEVPEPVRVKIPSIGVDAAVVNPKSRDVAVLDKALAEGVVRYPGSGTLREENANLFLFGHSSYLPVVRNPAFRAFNGLAKLSKGDEIFVESNARVYRYRVTSVRRASAEEALVDFSRGERRLTLSTCDSFGKPSDRFVVEAFYEGSGPLTP